MTRRHDIDALRAIAFALLILYHVGMLYVLDWDWHIKSSYQAQWLHWPMLFLNRWRMDLIFLISGVASAFLLKPDHVGRFLWQRHTRLVLPLVFGVLVIVPIQPYVQGVSNGLVEPGFAKFLGDYFSGKTWPAGAFSGWQYGFTWNHLWYLAYLWMYTLALAVLAKPLNSQTGLALRARFTGLRGPALMVLPALPLLFFTLTLQPRFPETGDFIHDWYRNAIYFTVFLYGYLIARDRGFWAEAARLRRVCLGTALILAAIYLTAAAVLPDEISFTAQALVWTARNLYVWTMLLAILGWSHAYLNRPFRWLAWANEAVYPWYILHQSLIVLIAYWLVSLKLGPVLEPVLVLTGTVVGCWGLFAILRRLHWMRPLMGMKRRPALATASVDRSSTAAYS